MKVDFLDIQKGIAILIDPDKPSHLSHLLSLPISSKVNYFFIGGSGELNNDINETTDLIKSVSNIPCIIFPGASSQLSEKADALMVLSLISGRNPEYLIGKLVSKAKEIQNMSIEKIPVGYILIDGGTNTTTQKVTDTLPIAPSNLDEVVRTAIAGELLGMKAIYLEAGSGAIHTVSAELIKAVKEQINLPIIVGGGIRSLQVVNDMWEAGANLIVIGNALEQNPSLMEEFLQKL